MSEAFISILHIQYKILNKIGSQLQNIQLTI